MIWVVISEIVSWYFGDVDGKIGFCGKLVDYFFLGCFCK